MKDRKIDLIVIHCTATKEHADFGVEDVRRWHTSPPRNWSDIGYHYLVTLSGSIQTGRPLLKRGAHARGYNSSSVGVCYVGGLDGNMRPKDTRTEAQKLALTKIIFQLKNQYPDAKVVGHRDLPKVKKACPCFDAAIEYGDKKPLPKLIKKVVDPILEIARQLGLA